MRVDQLSRESRRQIDDLRIANYEAAKVEVGFADIPAGTPFKRQLEREQWAKVEAAAHSPARSQAMSDLITRLFREARSEKAKARAADPVACERRRIFSALRKLGFVREHTSGASAYYRCGSLVVRVSDHEVPMSAEREFNLQNGGRSWANSRWSFVIGSDDCFESWLEEIKNKLACI